MCMTNDFTAREKVKHQVSESDFSCSLSICVRFTPRGVLRYFLTYVSSDHFLGFKILNFNIFWGFQKNVYFLGYEDFVDIFLSSQNWTILRGHFYAF